ncbi:MAG TPA: hypothetical protein VFW40_05895 [Capsulimonadaceae bacterium]|nr:hypothetical protein [Capsulimonadaceae bacterium]
MQTSNFKRAGVALCLAIGVLGASFGCASQDAQPSPPAPKPAAVVQPTISPQKMMQSEIDGVKQNPRFTASEKAYLIQRIKGGQMGPSVAKTPSKPASSKGAHGKTADTEQAHR